jgi:hypothetical protein
MHQLAVFLLASYGVTTIITLSRLFRPLRVWLERKSKVAGHWIKCPMCIGVPVGAGWALIGLSPGTGLSWALDAVAAGFASSGFCWMMRVVLHRLGEDQL